jgi:hypothetical protein
MDIPSSCSCASNPCDRPDAVVVVLLWVRRRRKKLVCVLAEDESPDHVRFTNAFTFDDAVLLSSG